VDQSLLEPWLAKLEAEGLPNPAWFSIETWYLDVPESPQFCVKEALREKYHHGTMDYMESMGIRESIWGYFNPVLAL